ncbi:MAG: cytochrome b/b6 domain-containing protein [Mariprofundus sp.]|nr:cytochrome b/b6 domain-containing protein [Mariprofundus sp.]
MSTVDQKAKSATVPGYHPVTRWLHAGLVLGVIFQLICAVQMAHPDHAEGGHGGHAETTAAVETSPAHHSGHVDRVDVNSAAEATHIEGIHMNATAHAEPVMAEPQHAMIMKKDVAGEWWMGAHRVVGVLVALIVLANLLWAIALRGNPRKRQMAVLVSGRHWSEAGTVLKHLPLMLVGKKPLPEPGNALSLIVEMFGMLTMTAMAVSGAIIWSLWAGPGNTVSEPAELLMEVHAGFAVLLIAYLLGHVSMALLHMRSGDSVFARIIP